MNRHKFYLMSPAYPARADQTQRETALRASPKEPEGTSCLAFEVQVNSYCHGQPLRIDRASPPILGLQESLGCGLLSPTLSSSHVPDQVAIYDGFVQPWPAAQSRRQR